MPLYYFHVRGDGIEILDPEGCECPDVQAAHREALAGARSILSEELKDGRLAVDERIDIEDEQGRLLCSVKFGEAIALPPGWTLRSPGSPEPAGRTGTSDHSPSH